MSSRPLIKDSLYLLNICGINFYKSDAWTNLRAVGTLTLLLVCWLNLLRELIMHWNGLESMELITLFAALYHLVSDYCLIMFYRKELAGVLTKFERFWSMESCSLELKEEIVSSQTFIRRCSQSLAVMLLFMASGFSIVAYLAGNTPLDTKYPVDITSSPNYEIAYLWEFSMMLIGTAAILGICTLFLAIIINITCEVKMLREGFERLPLSEEPGDFKEDLAGLYRLVDHHALIADCIAEIHAIYRIYLLNVYFYSTGLIGIGLLCIVASGFPPSIDSVARFGTIVVFYAFKLFFYCAAGSYLTSECDEIPASVYSMNWCIKTQPELRRACILILMRANKPETLSAGGIFTLDLPSFTAVMNTTFSLFTLMEALHEN